MYIIKKMEAKNRKENRKKEKEGRSYLIFKERKKERKTWKWKKEK